MMVKKADLNIFWMALFVLFAFWQTGLMVYIMKWDAVDIALPSRYLISECLNHGFLPLWNPYQKLGYPIHAEFSGVWYPVVWVISFVHGYDVHGLLFDFVFHLFLCGAGMYVFARSFGLRKDVSFLVGASYACCGFNVGNAQHIVWVISAAWLPIILHYFRQSILKPSFHAVFRTSLAFFMLMTGGYIAITFILVYLMGLIFIGYFIKCIRDGGLKATSGLFAVGAGTVLFSGLASAVIFAGSYLCFPNITRGEILTIDQINSNPFSPQSLLSLITPLCTAKGTFWDSDQSMANAFIGIGGLMFFVSWFFNKKTRWGWILLGFGVLTMFASFGKYTPVREWLYLYAPLLNLFRFPAVFRIFFILCFLLIAGFAAQNYFASKASPSRTIKTILYVIIAIVVVCLLVAIRSIDWSSTPLFSYTYFNRYFEQLPLFESLLIESVFQLIFLAIIVWSVSKDHMQRNRILLLTSLLNLVVFTQLSTPSSVISDTFSWDVQKHFPDLPKGFPVPQTQMVKDITNSGKDFCGLWVNMNMFYKEPSPQGAMSFVLKNYDAFEKSPLNNVSTNNRVIYLSSKISELDSVSVRLNTDSANAHVVLFLKHNDLLTYRRESLMSSVDDTVLITAFLPGKASAHVISNHAQMISLLQSDYPGWEVRIDGKQVPHVTSNLTFISALMPAGEHDVEFVLNLVLVKYGMWVTVIMLIIMTGALSSGWIRNRRKEKEAQ